MDFLLMANFGRVHFFNTDFAYCNFRPLEFNAEAKYIAEKSNFQLAGYRFEAEKESTRAARIVRLGR